MDILSLKELISGNFPWQGFDEKKQIQSGYVSDLLSLVMGNGKKDMAWITVQNHLNVVAVAALIEMGCVILVEGITLDPPVLHKAQEEGIPIIYTALSAYDVCVKMGSVSIKGTI